MDRVNRLLLRTIVLAAAAACNPAARTPAPQPILPAQGADTSLVAAPAVASTGAARRHVPADTRFMQHMIRHHEQALVMAGLAPARSRRDDVRLLAERIGVSQTSEIALIRRWLQKRGEKMPAADAAHHDHAMAMPHDSMPGMLGPAELAQLTAATGSDFDRLFLQFMIRHHEGALAMVRQLMGTQGAAQEAETFRFAADVSADQHSEIRRMRALQDDPPS